MARLFLIDGTALAYRSHFAFAQSRTGGLSTRDGRPTSAVYGFAMTLRALLEREKPDKIAIAFDGPREDLERTKIYADYKSTRQKMPDELVPQLDLVERVARGYGITVISSPGHEADDVIGTLARKGREAGDEVFIVTADKDFMQLVGERVKLWNLRGSTTAPEILGPEQVVAKFGVRPEQIVDLLALMGDSSDNVPGVPKVGEKTATGLLQQFGSLDAVLARAAEVKQPAIRQSLQQHREDAELSRRLVTLHTDVPLPVRVEDLGPAKPDRDVLDAIYAELDFDSLRATLPRPAAPKVDKRYTIVRSDDELAGLLERLRAVGRFAVATETTSRDPRRARLVGMGFSSAAGEACYVPFNMKPPLAGGHDGLIARLKPLLEDQTLAKTGQNTKHDFTVLRAASIEARGLEFDTMLASYCLSPGLGSHGLDALALRWFDYQKIPASDLVGKGKQQITFDQVDLERAGELGCEDADFTWRLRERLEPELRAAAVERVFAEIELPLVPVLLDMEWEGIAVDEKHLLRTAAEWQRRIDTISARIAERAGAELNPHSAQQIGEVLFDKLEVHRAAGIKPRRTKTGQWRTDADVLEALAPHHEVPRLLLEWRQLTKLKSTYADSLPQMVDPRTRRVHTTFNQAVAATGRLSSDDPNLQNIPIRTAEGREIRRAFVARGKGWQLLSADYSQIELRILAHFSQDQALVDSFRRGEDIHARTAALVHGLLPAAVTPELRNQAKVINYGLMYGMGASRLGAETGMTPPEARKFIEAYFRALPRVKAWLDDTLAQAKASKEVRTLFGRRRQLPDLDSTNAMQRIAAENMAVNTPIQGSAADIIKRAMLALHKELDARGLEARLLLQVHDELVLDVPEDELDRVAALVKLCMREAAELAVPLEVSVGHGANWLDAH
jgi:DNA polymerase-1